jgi:hypothetical protein
VSDVSDFAIDYHCSADISIDAHVYGVSNLAYGIGASSTFNTFCHVHPCTNCVPTVVGPVTAGQVSIRLAMVL